MGQKRRGRQEEMPHWGGRIERMRSQAGAGEALAFQSLLLLPYLCLPRVFCNPMPGGTSLRSTRRPFEIDLQFGLPAHSRRSSLHSGGPAALRGVRGSAGLSDLARGWPRLSLPQWVLDSQDRRDMEPSPATGGSETTRLVSPRDRGGAGGGLRLKR